MGNDGTIYLVDTDVLVLIHLRNDSQHIYGGLIKFIKDGIVKTVRQVPGELRRFGAQFKIISPHSKDLVIAPKLQYTEDVKGRIQYLGENAPYLWEQTGYKNPDPADPWLVAVGSAHDYTVVTNERQRSSKGIPAACRLPDTKCRCIHGAHFLIEVGLVTEIDPATISTAAFFE